MPAPWIRTLKQTATLWSAGETYDDYGRGKRVAGDPVEIPCRWNDDASSTVNDAGEPVALHASVLVDREVAIGSILRLGTIDEYTVAASGTAAVTADLGLMEVVTKNSVPDLRNVGKARTLGLARFRDALPSAET